MVHKNRLKIECSTDFDKISSFLDQTFSAPTHWPGWNKVVSRLYGSDFFYYTASIEDTIVGICPVHRLKKGLLASEYSGQFMYIPYGGWIWKPAIRVSKIKFLTGILTSSITYTLPMVAEFSTCTPKNDQPKFETLIVDLTQPIGTIWDNEIASKRRNMIRKAEKNGITIDIQRTFNEEFYSLYANACKRKGLFQLSFDFFQALNSTCYKEQFLILTAFKADFVLANMVVAFDKNYALYWLGNNAPNIANLGQGELLQWHAIKAMKEAGCHYYDLCYIEQRRLPDIYNFKRGFAKQTFLISFSNYKPISTRIVGRLSKLLK